MLERHRDIKRLAIRTAGVICTARLDIGEQGPIELLKVLTRPDSTKSDRLRAGLHLVGNVFPGFEERCANLFCSTDKMPVALDSDLELIGYGGVEVIFLLSSGERKKALKINRDSIGLPVDQLLNRLTQMQEKYQIIKSWYSHLPGFIPDEFFLIVHSHLFSMPAIATVQPYIEGEITGFFEDYSENELFETMRGNNTFKDQFSQFAKRLLEIYHDSQDCIDLLGKRNLAVIKENGRLQLMLIDPHGIYNSKVIAGGDNIHLQERIGRIANLLERVNQLE